MSDTTSGRPIARKRNKVMGFKEALVLPAGFQEATKTASGKSKSKADAGGAGSSGAGKNPERREKSQQEMNTLKLKAGIAFVESSR